MYYICAMRTVIRTEEFELFYDSLPVKVRAKLDYVLLALRTQRVVNSKFVKKLVDTPYYELRVSVRNEYRVIIVSINAENIMEAKQILLLNGFIKKSTKEYKFQITIADNILKKIDQ